MARLNWRMDRLEKLLKATVEAMGYQFWGLEFVSARGADTLRFYIEDADGWPGPQRGSDITADDCSQVSAHLSTLLDIEQPVSGNYRLEVSSPGMARRLFSAQQCAAAVGSRLELRLRQSGADGRRRCTARLLAAEEQALQMELDGRKVKYDWQQIEQVRLVPDFGAPQARIGRANRSLSPTAQEHRQ